MDFMQLLVFHLALGCGCTNNGVKDIQFKGEMKVGYRYRAAMAEKLLL
jgi:hypothetical protein